MSDEYYDVTAQGYDELYGAEQKKKLDLIINRLAGSLPARRDSLLDVGCGSGISTAVWNCCAAGVDPSSALILLAKKKYPKIDFIVGTAEFLPFPDASFDWVISLTALQNFSSPRDGLIEISRVAKGKVIISFLKQSPKADLLRKLISEIFVVADILDEEKDWCF